MRLPAITVMRAPVMWRWSVAVLAAIFLSACSAARPDPCEPGRGDGSAAAGRVLVGIAEVLVGAELMDRNDTTDRPACAKARRAEPSYAFGTADRIVSSPPEASAPEPRAVAKERPASGPPTQVSAAVRSSGALPVRPGRWILVRKSDRTLSVYEADRRLKTYKIVLGEDPIKPKLYEGDRRTPEGEYRIIAKHDHPEWQRFLLLDYPTADNREAYSHGLAEGVIPLRGGKGPGTGGAIGIHGTKDDDLNRQGVNWTQGCISLLNRDIRELYDTVPVGTPVLIQR